MIVVEDVSKYYGAHAAVSNLSFRIAAGEVVGLLGLNGAGKTTTLRILSGLLVPTSGNVEVAGINMAERPEQVRACLGFLPETPPVYGEMTVIKYLSFVARIKGIKGPLAGALADALDATDLRDVQNERINTLSHGYHRRVGIAQAIIHKPKLILMDEPTSGLDPVQVVHMRKLIRALRGKHTLLVSSHMLGEIHQLCDRIFVLQNGRIAAEGTEDELAQRVAGTTRIVIEVRGTSAALNEVLAAIPQVVSHRITQEAAGWTTAQIELQSDVRDAVAQRLVAAGFGLRRLERVRLALENIFLELTGNPEAASAPKAHS
jgi:ABC-2 type transport system ATP-binding protein